MKKFITLVILISCIVVFSLTLSVGSSFKINNEGAMMATDVSLVYNNCSFRSFDGASFIEYGKFSMQDIVDSTFTMCFWISTDSLGGTVVGAIDVDGVEFSIITSSDSIKVRTEQVELSTQYTIDTWGFISVVYDGSALILYKNAIEVDRASTSIVFTAGTSIIGARNNTGTKDEFFTGYMDEFSLYLKALSVEEIIETKGISITSVGSPIDTSFLEIYLRFETSTFVDLAE